MIFNSLVKLTILEKNKTINQTLISVFLTTRKFIAVNPIKQNVMEISFGLIKKNYYYV